MKNNFWKVQITTMRKLIYLILLCLPLSLQAQYSVQWARILGGYDWDEANQIIETDDGGYLAAGYTRTHYNKFVHLVKLDFEGNEEWNKTYEQDSVETVAEGVVQSNDGGFVVVGISIIKGIYTSDLLIMKVDFEGTLLWRKTYGNTMNDGGASIVHTADDGYALTGFKEAVPEADPDLWVLKTDNEGNLLWEQIFGGSKPDYGVSIAELEDQSLAIAGWTSSKGQAIRALWIMRMDAAGTWLWDETYKQTYWNVPAQITKTEKNGMIVAANYKSEGVADFDVWVLRLDSAGIILWDKSFGGDDWDEATSIDQTFDGGYVLAAFTHAQNDENANFWVIKIDSTGYLQWNQVFENSSIEFTSSIIETEDNGLLIAGSAHTNTGTDWEFAALKMKNDNLNLSKQPKIYFTEPAGTTTSTDGKITLKACIESESELENIQVYINDVLKVKSGLLDTAEIKDSIGNKICDFCFEKKVKLKRGINQIEIVVINASGTSYSETKMVYFRKPDGSE